MPSAPRVLLVAPTTGYQVARFQAAAASAGVELILATDCCHQLEATRAQEAVPIRFDNAKAALGALKPLGPFQGITAVGDRAAVLAAQVAPGLGVRFHSAGAAAVCHDKFEFKQVVAEADLPTPWFQRFALFDKPEPLAGPYFEESLYVTPSRLDTEKRALIWDMVEAAARAAGLGPGPIHAEIRL